MSGEAMRSTLAGSAAASAPLEAIAAPTTATAKPQRRRARVIESPRSRERNWSRLVRSIGDHEIEIASCISLQHVIEVKAPVSGCTRLRLPNDEPRAAAFEHVGRNAELEQARFDVETDRVAGLDEPERAADRGLRRDVQHDRAE